MTQIDLPSELLTKINTGKAALFLGAGASVPTGLPTGNELIGLLKSRFPECDTSITDFMDLCQDIEDTPSYSRDDLKDFMIDKLDLISLKDAHLSLTKYNWSGIFTTNFDEVVETAYRTSSSRLKSCTVVAKSSPSVNVSDRSKIYLFKIMGTLYGEDDQEMVLTKLEYINSIAKRKEYLKLLGDYVKSGTLIFIGYSFKDNIVKEIIREITSMYGTHKLPWSYMVMREVPQDTKSQHFLSSNHIIPIQGDFESFFGKLDQVGTDGLSEQTEYQSNVAATLRIYGRHISIDENHLKMYSSSFEIMYEEVLDRGDNIEGFLKGKNRDWRGYGNNWDFKRECYNSKNLSLKSAINEELNNQEGEKNKILYLVGMPGCGKTMMSYRIGYDYYKEGKGPVLIFDKNNKIDFKIVSTFIENVNTQYDSFIKESERIKPFKPLLIIDDSALDIKEMIRLKEFLESRGRSTLLLINCRLNEIEIQEYDLKIKIPEKDKFVLAETLNGEEQDKIIEYLFKHNFITSKSDKQKEYISHKLENSIFATFYTLVHPSKKPLSEIIKDQFNSLDQDARRAYLIICCFSQYDIYINVELLVRALNISYESYYKILANVKKIIFDVVDFVGNICYRTHHKIIAQKTIEFFLGKKELYELYIDILDACLISNNKERGVIEQFLIENFSKDSHSEFKLEERQELFKKVCDRSPTRSLCHHLGLLCLEMGAFDDAQKFLLSALELPREDSDTFRGESDQNILTSLGKLNYLTGMKLQRENLYNKAAEKFEDAERYFDDAKHGDFPNAYAYHAHANMWLQKAKLESSARPEEKIKLISKSIEITDKAHDNISQDELAPILELETMIWAFIGENGRVKELSEQIHEKFDSPNGYYVSAYSFFKKSLESTTYKQLNIDACLKVLNVALSKYPKDSKCLALKCKVLLNSSISTVDELFETLSSWYYSASPESSFLLYSFGRISFINGSYDISKEVFEELERGIGLGSSQRSKFGDEIIDEKTSKFKIFHGEISDIFNKYDGKIKVTSLPGNMKLNFRPIASKFSVTRGENVIFNIAFSYRGPYAINILKS
jgi:hypothetical protein